MGVERLEGLTSKDSYFDFVIGKVNEQVKNHPGSSPFYFLAEEFGIEGRDDLKSVDKVITDSLGLEPGEAPDEPLYPRSNLYQMLSLYDRQKFLVGYAGVWLEAVIKCYLNAKNTHAFDFRLFKAIYNERVRGTCVIEFKEQKSITINGEKVDTLFERDRSGAIFLSDEGLEINPPLGYLLNTYDSIPILRARTVPAYSSFADAFKPKPLAIKIPKVTFDEKKWTDMWTKPASGTNK